MTITSNLFIEAASPGRKPGLLAQLIGSHAVDGLVALLAAALALVPLTPRLWLGADTPKATSTPSAGAEPVITDSPPPAYVLRLERDPFR